MYDWLRFAFMPFYAFMRLCPDGYWRLDENPHACITSAEELRRGKHDSLMSICAAPPVQDASSQQNACSFQHTAAQLERDNNNNYNNKNTNSCYVIV